jgi:chromosomal replication initiator protein
VASIWPNDVAQLVADRITSNVRELEGAVSRLTAFAALKRQRITFPLAQDLVG